MKQSPTASICLCGPRSSQLIILERETRQIITVHQCIDVEFRAGNDEEYKTVIHFRKSGLGCIDVKFRAENEEEYKSVQVDFPIEDTKFVMARMVNSLGSVAKARCASAVRVNCDEQ